MIFLVMLLGILCALCFGMFRVLSGPGVFDRALAANFMGTGMILLLIVVGFLSGRPDFLDLCLTFTLLNTIGTLAILKFWRYGDLGYTGEEPEE